MSWNSSYISLHNVEHLPYRGGQTGLNGPAYESVADIQFHHVGDDMQERNITDIQSVPGVDPESELVGQSGGGDQSFDLPVAFGRLFEMFREVAGVQLDELGADLGGRLHLAGFGSDEKADLDPGVVEAETGFSEREDRSRRIESPLGGNFIATLRHEAHNLWMNVEGDFDHLWHVGHFQIETRANCSTEAMDIVVDDMTTVFAEMCCDAVRSSGFAQQGGSHRIGFPAGLPPVASLSEGGYVVDVDAELEHERGFTIAVAGGEAWVPFP